ncbi:MAG: hypothetical protein M1840_006301 [Geoglossum simile]|nr:MAG: hypothetical protein M1840_006301 [Geoglossum simile]
MVSRSLYHIVCGRLGLKEKTQSRNEKEGGQAEGLVRGGTYLSIIRFAGGKEGTQRVVRGQNEPSSIYKKLAGDIEEDEKEVHARKAEECIDFGDRSLLLEVVENFVLRQLLRRQKKRTISATRPVHSLESIALGVGFCEKGDDGLSDGPDQTHLLVDLGDRILSTLLERHVAIAVAIAIADVIASVGGRKRKQSGSGSVGVSVDTNYRVQKQATMTDG